MKNNYNVKLSLNPTKIRQNGTESNIVNLSVENIDQLIGYDIELGINTPYIDEFHIEPFFINKEKNGSNISLKDKMMTKEGIIKYTVSGLKPELFKGNLTLLNLSYKGNSNGSIPIKLLSAHLIQKDGEFIPYSFNDEAINPIPDFNKKHQILEVFISPFTNEINLRYRVEKSGTVYFSACNFLGDSVFHSDKYYRKKGDYFISFQTKSLISGLYIYSYWLDDTCVGSKVVEIYE